MNLLRMQKPNARKLTVGSSHSTNESLSPLDMYYRVVLIFVVTGHICETSPFCQTSLMCISITIKCIIRLWFDVQK
jgi:hypothetical protein